MLFLINMTIKMRSNGKHNGSAAANGSMSVKIRGNGKHKRLSEVLESAERINFSNEDRIVFFSDIHRGNNSWADEFARNQVIYSYALQHYYDAGFTYVEVGDGDELMKFKSVETIRHAHEQIYLLLQRYHQEERFYYIYGNHDIEYRDPDTLADILNCQLSWFTEDEDILFDDFLVYEGLIFSHQESGTEFFVVHGHQGELMNDKLFWLSRLLLRGLWRPLQLLGLQDPTSLAQNVEKREKVERQFINWVETTRQPMICGHIHLENFPKNGEPPYFNTGSCVHPRWITCIEIENGKIALVRWQIKSNKAGSLIIKRDVIGGPEAIHSFSDWVPAS
jgi:UDP-2,3-diacylglucosamine pyrophosphatase LpxH